MEYEVYELDPTMVRCHRGDLLFESDNLHWAIMFAARTCVLKQFSTCVWQPRTQGYRNYYKFEECK